MIALTADPSPVYALAFRPDGSRLVAGTRGGGVHFFTEFGPDPDLPPGPLLGEPVTALAFGPAGDWLAVGGGMGWHAHGVTGAAAGPLRRPRRLPRVVAGLAFVTDTLLAVGFGDRARAGGGSLELFDVATNKPREPKHPAPEGVRAVAACPALKRVAWAEWGRRVSVWDAESVAPVRLPLAHAPAAVALSPDGGRVAAAAQWQAAVFEVATRRETLTLKGHKGPVTAVGFAPDGRSIATGSWDGTVKFWGAESGTPAATYDWGVGKVCSLAYSPDGLRLAVGGDKGGIAVVDVG